MISIVIVDDAPDVRGLLRTRLRLTKEFEVVGEGGTGAEAVAAAIELRPDMVLLDVSMPGMDGLEALERIVQIEDAPTVVMFSGFEEQGLAERARALGAADFVEKSASMDELVARLIAACRGEEHARRRIGPSVPEPVLQEHLERFRAAFDEAAIGMATLTLTLRVVRANAAMEALLGAPAGSLVGASYLELVGESRRRAFSDAVADVATGERDSVSIEHDIAARDVVSTVAVVRDSGRAPLYLFLQAQDVSERRAAEEELRRSQQMFRLLVESVGDYAIFMLDPTGHVASWNLGAQRAKGYEAHEILGKHFSVFYPPEAVAAGHPQYELEVAVAEGRYEEEGLRVRKDGSTFLANVIITAVRDHSGELVGFAKVTRDVTERNELLQDLSAAAAQRTQLLAVTAHELRTPVSVVKGFVSTLHDHWDDLDEQERREMVAALDRSGDRLSRLVDDLFTAARLESRALEVRPSTFDLTELIREVVADHGGGDVTFDGGPMAVLADRGRTQQILTNYVNNARRYGDPPITVEIARVGDAAEVVVADSGEGVAPALVPHLFGKFASGGSKEGSGLGLFIVRELARAQGGDAWYEPAPGGGARFGFRVPLAPE